MHLLTEAPGIVERCGGKHRPRRRCSWHRLLYEAADQFGLEAQLFRVGDVLPGAAPTHAEVLAACRHAMWRSTEDLDERRGALPRHVQRCEDSFARNRQRDRNGAATVTSDAVAGRIQVIDVEK
jgi:hypothetical protein